MHGDERHFSVIRQELDTEIEPQMESSRLCYARKYRNLSPDPSYSKYVPKIFYSDVVDANIFLQMMLKMKH